MMLFFTDRKKTRRWLHRSTECQKGSIKNSTLHGKCISKRWVNSPTPLFFFVDFILKTCVIATFLSFLGLYGANCAIKLWMSQSMLVWHLSHHPQLIVSRLKETVTSVFHPSVFANICVGQTPTNKRSSCRAFENSRFNIDGFQLDDCNTSPVFAHWLGMECESQHLSRPTQYALRYTVLTLPKAHRDTLRESISIWAFRMCPRVLVFPLGCDGAFKALRKFTSEGNINRK